MPRTGGPPPIAVESSPSLAGESSPSIENNSIKSICDDILAFRRSNEGRVPCRGANVSVEERRLGNFKYKLRMRCASALDHKPSNRKLNAEEIAYFENAVAAEMPTQEHGTSISSSSHGGAPTLNSHNTQPENLSTLPAKGKKRAASSQHQDNTSTVGVASPIDEEVQKSRMSKAGAVPSRTDSTSSVASLNAKGRTPHITTSRASSSSQTHIATNAHHQQNPHTAASGSSLRIPVHVQNGMLTAGTGLPAKRKRLGSTCIESGATPPTRRIKAGDGHATSNTKETLPSLEEWTELHEFAAWLELPEATRIRKEHIEKDKQGLKDLMVHPATRATLQSAARILNVARNNQSLALWQSRCCQEALQRFRRWQNGGMLNWMRAGPSPVVLGTIDHCITGVETITELGLRQDYWWTTTLTQTVRRCIALKAKHPQLLSQDEWKTLLVRLQMVLQSTTRRNIYKAFQKHKDLIRAAAVHKGHREPTIASPDCSLEGVKKANVFTPPLTIHYHLSCFLANTVQMLQCRSDKLDALTASTANDDSIGVISPESQADTQSIGAKSPESQSTSTSLQQKMVTKKKKQSQRAFFTMCRSQPDNLPYCAFQEHIEALDASVSQDIRHLALINMKECTYQQLPLVNSQLLKVIKKHSENARHGFETELEYIQAAQQRLCEFAVLPGNAYASIRFLGMQRKDAQAVQEATEKIVNDLVKLMDENELGDIWASSWHPHRFAAVAAYAYVFLADAADTASRWNWAVDPKRMYIPIDQIQSLPKLASHCPPSPEMLGVKAVPSRVEGTDAEPSRVLEAAGQALATPPVVCELCHRGFRCKEDLITHCKSMHGNFAEYRKHVFWKAQEHGLHPLEWWQKRAILSSHAYFHRYSIPESHQIDYTRNLDEAVPRRMEACAICAVKDWIEHRYRVYLFAAPDGKRSYVYKGGHSQGRDTSEGIQCYEAEGCNESSDASSLATPGSYYKKGNCLCIGHPDKVDKILGVQHYSKAWPQIPSEELYASSVQHPHHPNMHWLLHSRRVPKHDSRFNHGSEADEATGSQEPEHGAPPPVHIPRCAGIGKEDETVWACFDCARNLCQECPEMPPLALANWMWLGRVHHFFRDLSLAMRLLLGLGRPMMRSLYLGRGPRDEVHRGLQGNTMIVAQASATYKQVVPDVNNVLSGLNVIFCKTIDEVSNAHMLIVQPDQYAPAMRRRIRVCPTFADVKLDEVAVARDLPTSGVPPAFVEHALHMPETTTMRTTMDGPASRHSQFGPNPVDDSDQDDDEDAPTGCIESSDAPSLATNVHTDMCREDQTNDFETILGIDTASDEPEVHLFATMQSKLELLTSEAKKIAKAATTEGEAPTAQVGAHEQCKRIVVDLQDVAKRLSKTKPHTLDRLATSHVHPGVDALAIPSGALMSTFHAATLPAAYVEFQFGDCTPFLKRPKEIPCKQIFAALPWREELEYHLEPDSPTEPYTAPDRSRFDEPEFMMLFADILRRMTTNQSVAAALRREGFEQDEKAIASVSSDEILQSMVKSGREADVAQPHTNTSTAVEKAIRNLMFSTATVPLTDGYKMRLRHMGHAMNIVFGPLTSFSTHNFPDTYSHLSRALFESHGQMPIEEEPTMPTLQEMHRLTAASPASTASFWLLRQALAFTHLYGMDMMHIGKLHLRTGDDKYFREDNLASSGVAGISGFAESSLVPGEAQGRGFEHGHDKKTSIPKGHVVQHAELRNLCQQTSDSLNACDSDAPPLASTETKMLSAMENYNKRLIPYVTSRQHGSHVGNISTE